MAEMDCPATKVTGPGRRLPPCSPHRPELRAATARRDLGFPRGRDDARVIVPARLLLLRRRVGDY